MKRSFGDRNQEKSDFEKEIETRSFFQASVKSNRDKNSLKFLSDEHEREQFSNQSKGGVAERYFSELFKTSSPESFSDVFSDFSPRVTKRMNADLTCEVTIEEVRLAIFSTESEKATGHDGMTGFFYKKYWEVVKDQLFADVKLFFSSGKIQGEWNHTHITLIPKITTPRRMTDLRPISLCTVLYKIMSKIFTSQLKKILPAIVSPTQQLLYRNASSLITYKLRMRLYTVLVHIRKSQRSS
ncbi:unnamed protein product [Microthlaspi erraticum]|uniref:Reverse transcriptase domain-containing protein n=1 Tax=Microthlaspi erraticum TaxID=1685480 RepID=A0A6D2J702_9BRAS|nr:unnamed protein product [Microthlaspi erraticum]CAA7036228.1 unnamed protein product [Microthlaspi erraticum]